MHEICKDVFEDDVILVPETSKKPTDKENLNLNTQSPNSILKEDHFMPVEQIESPYLLPAEYNQQCQHIQQRNQDSTILKYRLSPNSVRYLYLHLRIIPSSSTDITN